MFELILITALAAPCENGVCLVPFRAAVEFEPVRTTTLVVQERVERRPVIRALRSRLQERPIVRRVFRRR